MAGALYYAKSELNARPAEYSVHLLGKLPDLRYTGSVNMVQQGLINIREEQSLNKTTVCETRA